VLQNSVVKIGMFSYLTARLNESLGWLADTEKWRVSAGNGVVDKIRRFWKLATRLSGKRAAISLAVPQTASVMR
jgi:hypothetical protein